MRERNARGMSEAPISPPSRLAGLRFTVLAAIALTLSLTTPQLAQAREARSLGEIAAAQHVPLARVASIALTSAEPQLDEAVRTGAITDAERRDLRRRIREGVFV